MLSCYGESNLAGGAFGLTFGKPFQALFFWALNIVRIYPGKPFQAFQFRRFQTVIAVMGITNQSTPGLHSGGNRNAARQLPTDIIDGPHLRFVAQVVTGSKQNEGNIQNA